MPDLTLDQLVDALPKLNTAFDIRAGATLLRPAKPSSEFVAPPMAINTEMSNTTDLQTADIIVIHAAAAAGKSMLADHLADAIGAPVLDFAYPDTLAPGPNLLTGQIGMLRIGTMADLNDAFRAGSLPLVIDALDEGLGRSWIGFESFADTVWEEYGPPVGHPKAVFIGRDQAVVSLLSTAPDDLSFLVIDLCLFDRTSAEQVLLRHSQKAAAEWDEGKEMTREMVAAFFSASARVFGCEPNDVFEHAEGRAFVGYAPVLATVGASFGRDKNPSRLAGHLGNATGGAWQIIGSVLDELLEREQEKFRGWLTPAIAADVPEAQWAPAHQLTVLASILNGHDVESDLVVETVPTAATNDCRRAARTSLDDHPFLVNRTKPRTQLFSARILAAAAIDGEGASTEALRDAARFPFLWRFLRSLLDVKAPPCPALEPGFCAAVLASLWQDTDESALVVRVDDDRVSVAGRETIVEFLLDGHLELWGTCRRIEANVERIVLVGERFELAAPSNTLRCNELELPDRQLQIGTGEAIIRAATLSHLGSDLRVEVGPGTNLRVGGALLQSHLFRDYAPDTYFTPTRSEKLYKLLDDVESYHARGEVLHIDNNGNPSASGPQAGGLRPELIGPVAHLVRTLDQTGLVDLVAAGVGYTRVTPKGWQWHDAVDRYVEFREGRTIASSWRTAFVELGAEPGTALAL